MKTTVPVNPAQFNISTGTGNPDSRYTKDTDIKYDTASGNMIQDKTKDLVGKSYIWDYKNSYPVAVAVNALADDIAFCSFEADGKGNWNFTGIPLPDPSAPSGKKIYPVSSGAVTKTVSSTKTYIVSFWKNGGVNVANGTLFRTGRTIGQWTYVEYQVTNAANIIINGSGSIDELRLYPKNAQMTSYTYEPLVGLTTQSDANGNILYYEYDALGRLKFVRDMDKNVVKAMDYKYNAGVND
jgi:YD repeat-containing protein